MKRKKKYIYIYKMFEVTKVHKLSGWSLPRVLLKLNWRRHYT